MLKFLPFLLFLAVPLTEIALFITIGSQIGVLATVGIVFLTAAIGAAMLRQQGFAVMRQAQAEMDAGQVPVARIADGVCLLVAALLLLTPGFLTDTIGFLLFVPPIRQSLGHRVWRWFKDHEVVSFGTMGRSRDQSRNGPSTIDGEAVEIDPDQTSSFSSQSSPDPGNSPWRTS